MIHSMFRMKKERMNEYTVKIVQLTVTNNCQCSCRHCGVDTIRKSIENKMDIDTIQNVFKQLKKVGCDVIDIFGGEPTLRKDLCDIILLGKKFEYEIALETNGFLLDEDYVIRLKKSGLDQLYLSLDSHIPEEHDDRRGVKGIFNKVVNAIHQCRNYNIPVTISFVPDNIIFFTSGKINKFLKFCKDNGSTNVRLLFPRYVGKAMENQDFQGGEEYIAFSNIDEEFQDFVFVHSPDTPCGEINKCTAKKYFCHIMSNGYVAPCPYFPVVFGDITKEPIELIIKRIRNHPLTKLSGDYCATRSNEYINEYLKEVKNGAPFLVINDSSNYDG